MKIIINITNRKARVSLSRKAYENRCSGLIQFLSDFADNIIYEIVEVKEKK